MPETSPEIESSLPHSPVPASGRAGSPASQPPIPTGVVASPCVRQCLLNGQGICTGCFRHSQEIGLWSAASNQQKQQIVAAAMRRRAETLIDR
ncbi:DUF1289 domain-containing protein [Crateriforma conspicua]|uniref:Fe-S protein n=1 Tax=Crateriforma conspicua TaxID=2527996 RepID=A0A5C6FUJ1_9PLAN|nr:hypothetical protein V7x_07060 [Crateriforma conspicua]